MDRLKNSGFYKLKFFITPEEFENVLKFFEQQQTQFRLTNYDQTKHDLNQVYAAYQAYYQYFVAEDKRSDYHPFFVYSISATLDNESSGFFVRNEGISFPYDNKWAEDELPYMMLSMPKGLQVDMEDEAGKYYIYEDIRNHKPLTYTLFTEITDYIKQVTKPLRFSALDAAAMPEQKPSVRISRDAIQNISKSWICNKYGLLIKGK